MRLEVESSSNGEAIFLSEDSEVDHEDDDSPSPPLGLDDQTELEQISQLLIGSCCSKYCVRQITVNDILLCRKKFGAMSVAEQRQWLADKIFENSDKSTQETKYIIAGKETCKLSFCQVYGFPPKRLSRIKKAVSAGQVTIEHGNKGNPKTTTRGIEAKTWMKRYFELIGDKMPDKDQIHLPSWDTQKAVYQRYRDMMKMGSYISIT